MSINLTKVQDYAESKVDIFHKKRIERLSELKLFNVLKRKNPYLFKAKNVNTSFELVKGVLDAYLSSQEETIFGEFLESLAIYVNSLVYNGKKSSAEGIDLEFSKGSIKYIVSIKSGPNWGNSSQIKKMKDNFNKAKRILKTNTSKINIVAVNGCCYGKDNNPEKDSYIKLCGQDFWEFISGEEGLYIDIIKPIGHKARSKNEAFLDDYDKVLNIFTKEFTLKFCTKGGEILWEKLIKFNSQSKKYLDEKSNNTH